MDALNDLDLSVEEIERRAVAAGEVGDYAASMHLFQQALSAYRGMLYTGLRREHYLLVSIGYAAQECGELDVARKHHEEALRLLRHADAPDHELLARTLHYLGDTHLQRNEPQIAEIYLKESADWFGHVSDYENAAHVVYDLAMRAKERGDREEAQRRYFECLKLARMNNGLRYQVRALCAISELALDADAKESAQDFFVDALRCAEEASIETHTVSIWNRLGYTAAHLGDDETAVRCWETALRIARERQDAGAIAGVLHNLGQCETRRNNVETAQRQLDESLEIRRSLGDTESIARSLLSQGSLASRKQDYADARRWNIESLLLFRSLGNRAETVRLLYAIACMEKDLRRLGQAALLFGAAERLVEEPGAEDYLLPHHKSYLTAMKRELGSRRHAWNKGCALTYDEAINAAAKELPTATPLLRRWLRSRRHHPSEAPRTAETVPAVTVGSGGSAPRP